MLSQSGPGSNGNEEVSPHFPNLKGWSLDIRWFNVIIRTLAEEVLPICRDSVSAIFMAPANWAYIPSLSSKSFVAPAHPFLNILQHDIETVMLKNVENRMGART